MVPPKAKTEEACSELEHRVAAAAVKEPAGPVPGQQPPSAPAEGLTGPLSPASSERSGQDLSTPFSVFNITESIVYPDTRAVVCPPVAGSELEAVSLPAPAALDVVVARQSSENTDFMLDLGEGRRCSFYYDVASDNLIALNVGTPTLHLLAVETGADAGGPFGKSAELVEHAVRPLSPGPWRIMSDKDGHAGDCLVQLLLFRRRFAVTKSSNIAAGSKRPAPDADPAAATIADAQNSELAICPEDNPMLDVRPSTKLSVQSPDPADTFVLSNLRDIVNRPATIVFKGEHSALGDTVVKVIKTESYSAESYDIYHLANEWRQEVKFLQSVSHPAIIKLLGSDARFFTVFMEHLPAPDLGMQMSTPSCLFHGTAEDAARVLSDMASALDYLAGEKILHNDIKPGNIVYLRGRGAVLIDFGLASKPGDPFTGGTAYYIAPEVEFGVRGVASDMFSLGVTMLYLLRKVPLPEYTVRHWGDDMWRLPQARQWYGSVAAHEVRLKNKDGIEGVVARMLARDPRDRISAKELLEKVNCTAPAGAAKDDEQVTN